MSGIVYDNFSVVIISRNQAEYLAEMDKSLDKYKRIYVLDRCNDNSKKLLKELGREFYTTPFYWLGRKTSSVRNLGLSHTNGDVLFLDGDRFVVTGTLDGLMETDKDILLLKVQNDPRDNEGDLDKHYGRVENKFYSCGVFFKKRAIEKITEFCNGELFPTFIEKYWGLEDTTLGDICYHLGLTCGYYDGCRLNGKINYQLIESKGLLKRMNFRKKLNILW